MVMTPPGPGGGTEELDVSIVLPVFNEQGHLHAEIDRIRDAMDASRFSYEIIVIDDGSSDGSGEALRAIEGIRLIQFGTNRGSGSARKYGTQASRGRVVVWTDVDMTYPTTSSPSWSRSSTATTRSSAPARPSRARTRRSGCRPSGSSASWRRYLAADPDPRPELGPAGVPPRRRAAVHQPAARRLLVRHHDHDDLPRPRVLGEVLADRVPRAGRALEVPLVADTHRYLLQVVRMIVSYNPLRLFLPLGLFLSVLGGAKLAYDCIADDFAVAINTLVILLAAFNVFSIGLLADLVGRSTRRRDEVPWASSPRTDLSTVDEARRAGGAAGGRGLTLPTPP